MTIPPRPPHYINFFEPFHFLAGDQLVVPIGASHISLPLQETQSREWEKKEQTNNMLGLTLVQKGSYVTLCICRLTLAWISREKFYNATGMPTYLDQTSLTGLDHLSSRLVSLLSGVDSPVPSSVANCLLLVPLSNSLTRVPLIHFRSC